MKFKPSHRDFYSVPMGRLKISKFAPAETFKSAKPRMATGASNPVTQRRVRAPGQQCGGRHHGQRRAGT
jgi:hypothetical protein